MKFLHLANFNSTNIGNGALIFGTERVLREDLGGEMDFRPEAWDEYVIEDSFGSRKFNEGFTDIVNRYDVLLVGGAVTFNGRQHLTGAGMRFNLPLDLWPKIEKPIIFYGSSYRFWPSQRYHNVEKLRDAVRYIIGSPRILFGVRNDGTKKFLESLLGFASEKIISIPDPGLYVPAGDGEYPEINKGRINMVLSMNNEDESDRFPDHDKKLLFLKGLGRALERLTRDWDLNIIFAPHHLDDYKIISELVSLLPHTIIHQRAVSSGLLKIPQTPYFYGRYRKADLVLSMRIHSMSPAIGLGVPVIPLISQARMSDFLEDMGLDDLGIDIFDPDFEEKLCQKANYTLSDKADMQRNLKQALGRARFRTLRFDQQVRDLLEGQQ